jgi:uncharacterized membrane protein
VNTPRGSQIPGSAGEAQQTLAGAPKGGLPAGTGVAVGPSNAQEDTTMRTPASIAGHPIHPMIVPIAIGGLVLSFIFDIVCLATGATDPWSSVAYYTMIGGIVGALCAAIFGLVDLISLPKGYTKNVAYTHMGINLTVVALFIVNAFLRHGEGTTTGTFILSLIGIALLVVSGWLGGKMVFEAGVGVSAGAEGAATPSRPGNRHIEA